MEYSIGEFAVRTGLGIHTLRYYEKERLIEPQRNNANRRRYSENDIAWVEFIKRLKATGMPIKEIQLYAALRAQGDATLEERLEMLINHQANLAAQISEMQDHQDKLTEKIDYYRREIKRVARRAKHA